MSNVLYILAGIYLAAMGFFLKTVPGESGPFVSGDERVKREATPIKRILVIALGLLMLTYGVYEVVQARRHPEQPSRNPDTPHAIQEGA